MPPPCLILIPVYNHERAIGPLVERLRRHGLPILLIDDGSAATCAQTLRGLHESTPEAVGLIRLPRNAGKGAAMLAGFREAGRRGFEQVLQIDADGQHEAEDVPRFLALGTAHPGALVCGVPRFDATVPKARLIGRYATHAWVWINTLSFGIRDSMCGFRLYPLAPVLELIDQEPIGTRMDFDSEILVRLHWRGLQVVNLPTRVTYPQDGVSHFRLLADNLRISRMHARLFFGMLRRLPRLLRQRVA